MLTFYKPLLGKLISYHRVTKYNNGENNEFKQDNFIIDSNGSFICTKSTLSKLENGKVSTDRLYIKFIEKLSMTCDIDEELNQRLSDYHNELLYNFTCYKVANIKDILSITTKLLINKENDIYYSEILNIYKIIYAYLNDTKINTNEIDHLMKIYDDLPDPIRYLSIYLIESYINLEEANYQKAIAFYRQNSIDSLIHKHILIDEVSADIYLLLGNSLKAMNIMDEMIKHIDKVNYEYIFFVYHYMMGRIKMDSNIEEAFDHLSLAIEYSLSHSVDPFILSRIHREIGFIYISKNKYAYALESFNEAKKYRPRSIIRNLPFFMYIISKLDLPNATELQLYYLQEARHYQDRFTTFFCNFIDYYELKLYEKDYMVLIKFIINTFPESFVGLCKRDLIVKIISDDIRIYCGELGCYSKYIKFNRLIDKYCTMV